MWSASSGAAAQPAPFQHPPPCRRPAWKKTECASWQPVLQRPAGSVLPTQARRASHQKTGEPAWEGGGVKYVMWGDGHKNSLKHTENKTQTHNRPPTQVRRALLPSAPFSLLQGLAVVRHTHTKHYNSYSISVILRASLNLLPKQL